jgi:biopolymer transport protein ExbD
MQFSGRQNHIPEVPVAPMLDVAFNILAFFIFTFNPAPVELQFKLNLLPARPAAEPEDAPTTSDAPAELPAPISTLSTVLSSDGASGALRSIRLEEIEYDSLEEFAARIKVIAADPEITFDQAEIRVDPYLDYQYLIQVVNIFAANKITKISFAELR